jgi:hypothetical protein
MKREDKLRTQFARQSHYYACDTNYCNINIIIFSNLNSERVESNWVHSVRRPPIGLLSLPRVIMMMENLEE